MQIEDEKHAIGSWNSDFVELFECLPLIEHLHMSSYPVKVTHIDPRLYLIQLQVQLSFANRLILVFFVFFFG